MLALLTCGSAPAGASQSSTPRFERVELVSPAGEHSGMPHLNLGADGETYLSWLEDLEGPSARMAFARLGPDGWSPAQRIASGKDWFNNWADRPSIAALADGTLIAHWLQRLGQGTYAYGVRFSISRDAGAHWDAPRWLHADEQAVEHGFASFVALDEQRFAAVWLDGRATGKPGATDTGFEKGPQQLYFRTIERSGALGEEVCLDKSVCDCCPTSLRSLGTGRLALSYRDRTPLEVRDVMLMSFAAGRWSGPERLDEDAWVIPGCPVNGPSLDSNGAAFGLAWYSGAREESRVLALLCSADGDRSDPVQVDLGAPEGRTSSVLWNEQSLLIAWLEHAEQGPAWMLRSLTQQGALGEPMLLARVPGNRDSGYARLLRIPKGLVFVWTDPKSMRVLSCRLAERP